MSRGKIAHAIRPVNPDPQYGSKIISKIVNRLMMSGNKATVLKSMYEGVEKLKPFIEEKFEEYTQGSVNDYSGADYNKKVVVFFEVLINKIAPTIEIRSRRVGGSNYQIPSPVNPRRSLCLAILWFVKGVRSRKAASLGDKIAAEIKDVFSGTGESMKKKEMVAKQAEANKAFAHFAN